MREHEWINTPEARQRRGERALFAIDDAIHALRNGKPIPENAERTLTEISRETARASAWRMIKRISREGPADTPQPAPDVPLAEPGLPYGWWEDDPAEPVRYDRAYFDRDEDP